ncbi:MAG: HAD family hydrolase [Bdellovibrionaceae bacterium]|nr:HAD family hydrolase [Pseudobdellovibrionaceae bacterium]
MPSPISAHLLDDLKRDCPELIPVLVTLWTKGHLGVDGGSLTGEELRWLIEHFPDVVVHENPEISVPRDPRSSVILGVSHELDNVDRFSPAHSLKLPIRDPEFRNRASAMLKRIAENEPTRIATPKLGPEPRTLPSAQPIAALFLDRDGTIIDLVPYITDPAAVVLKDGIVPLIRWARGRGMMVVCVTNQSGIGRGWYTWEQFDAVQSRMDELLAAEGVHLDATFAAGYFPDSAFVEGLVAPGLRKPSPGMLTWAASRLNLDLSRSVMIGDSDVDVEAGQRAGCLGAFKITPDLELTEILKQVESLTDR